MRGTLENLLNHVIDACPSSFSGSKHQVSFVLCVESDYFRPAFFLCLRTFTNSFLYCASSKPKPGFSSRDSLIAPSHNCRGSLFTPLSSTRKHQYQRWCISKQPPSLFSCWVPPQQRKFAIVHDQICCSSPW